MLFGAGIWLVAQIYHIEEHYPNGFLIWGLGAMALAWALPSVARAILAVLLLVLWNGFEVFDFKNPQALSPLLISAGTLPLAWAHRSRVLALSFHQRGGTWSIHLDRFPEGLLFFLFAAGSAGLWACSLWPASGKRLTRHETLQPEHYGVLTAFILMTAQALGVIRLGGWTGMAVFSSAISSGTGTWRHGPSTDGGK